MPKSREQILLEGMASIQAISSTISNAPAFDIRSDQEIDPAIAANLRLLSEKAALEKDESTRSAITALIAAYEKLQQKLDVQKKEQAAPPQPTNAISVAELASKEVGTNAAVKAGTGSIIARVVLPFNLSSQFNNVIIVLPQGQPPTKYIIISPPAGHQGPLGENLCKNIFETFLNFPSGPNTTKRLSLNSEHSKELVEFLLSSEEGSKILKQMQIQKITVNIGQNVGEKTAALAAQLEKMGIAYSIEPPKQTATATPPEKKPITPTPQQPLRASGPGEGGTPTGEKQTPTSTEEPRIASALREAEKRNEELREQVDQVKQALKTQEQEREKAEKQVTQARKEVEDARSQLANAESKSSHSEQEAKQAKDAAEGLKKELAETKKIEAQLRDRIAQLESQLKAQQDKAAAQSQEKDQLKIQLKEQQAAHSQESGQLKTQLAELKTQIDSLENHAKNLRQENATLTQTLHEVESGLEDQLPKVPSHTPKTPPPSDGPSGGMPTTTHASEVNMQALSAPPPISIKAIEDAPKIAKAAQQALQRAKNTAPENKEKALQTAETAAAAAEKIVLDLDRLFNTSDSSIVLKRQAVEAAEIANQTAVEVRREIKQLRESLKQPSVTGDSQKTGFDKEKEINAQQGRHPQSSPSTARTQTPETTSQRRGWPPDVLPPKEVKKPGQKPTARSSLQKHVSNEASSRRGP